MNDSAVALRRAALAFLAARRPGIYAARQVVERLNASGLLDAPATLADVERALALLAQPRMGLLSLEVDPLSSIVYFGATAEGVKQWTLDGRMTVD